MPVHRQALNVVGNYLKPLNISEEKVKPSKLRMDNSRIVEITTTFKERLRHEINVNVQHSEDIKYWLWKTLIMAEVAHRSFVLKTNIEDFEKPYFDRYTAVARHFRDWAMDWVANNYFEISHYIAKFYWPDSNKSGFNPDYIPSRHFN